jgi:hypothetical protein
MSCQRCVRLLSPSLVALLLLAGCGDSTPTPKTKSPPQPEAKHPAHGPNDGHVFELHADGGEHLHVEFFEDEKAKKLVAVLLGDDEQKEVQSSATEATLEVTAGGEKKEFKLKAEAKDNKASRYSSADKATLDAVKAQGAKVKFQVAVGGKTYTAEAEHIVH